MKFNRKIFASITAIIVSILFVVMQFLRISLFDAKYITPFVSIPLATLFIFSVSWVVAWMFAWLYTWIIRNNQKNKS